MKFHNQNLKPRREVANARSSGGVKYFGKYFMTSPAKSVLDDLEVRHCEPEFVTQL